MGSQNFIEINGKKYDALTGKQINHTASSMDIKKPTTIMPNSGGVVDGFVRPTRATNHKSNITTVSKSPQKSQTLMRKTVNKPTQTTGKPAEKSVLTKSKLGTSPKRLQTASEVKRSQHIQKYGQDINRSSVVRKQPAPVKPEPQSRKSPAVVPKLNATSSQPLTQRSLTSRKLIDAALANANSHNEQIQPAEKPKKRSKLAKKLGISTKVLTISSASLAAVLLIGFFAMQSVPKISMKVASTRAGLDARMPGYKPSGFAFKGPINYSPGEVSVSYSSNSDNREFQIVQKSSNWNSDALLSNYVVAEGKQYQTYQDRGRTLYIYDESNATWVDNGIWYQIEGDSYMTTDQLIRIASSI